VSPGRGRPRIEWEGSMQKLMKKGQNLQETPRLAKGRKGFRIWPMQPDARKGNKGIQEKELGVIYCGKNRRFGRTCCLNIQAVS
jgi:hypothetical protein